MMLRKLNSLLAICAIAAVFITAQSCSETNESIEELARVQLKLIDAPGDYLEVNVEIIDIQYRSSEEDGWESFESETDYPINVDLTELIAGNDLLLTDQVLPSGMLGQVRLVLSDNNTLKIEGEDELISLSTPSAQQSGLKLNLDTNLEAGFSYTFILDWNVQESIVKAGNSGNYILKPVIRVNAEVNSGSISGNVVEIIEDVETAMENVTVGVYDSGDEAVTETLTNENGEFLVQGLEAGSYTIKIAQQGYNEYISDEIIVTIGNVVSTGTIVLVAQ